MISSQHIGAAGELLVQYRLLKLGIDSARLTTDSGTDLVALEPGTGISHTIQVKTAREDRPAGGRGALTVSWTFPASTSTKLIAFVRLATDTVWLFETGEACTAAQQLSPTGIHRLYWFTGNDAPTGALTEAMFAGQLIESAAVRLLGA